MKTAVYIGLGLAVVAIAAYAFMLRNQLSKYEKLDALMKAKGTSIDEQVFEWSKPASTGRTVNA